MHVAFGFPIFSLSISFNHMESSFLWILSEEAEAFGAISLMGLTGLHNASLEAFCLPWESRDPIICFLDTIDKTMIAELCAIVNLWWSFYLSTINHNNNVRLYKVKIILTTYQFNVLKIFLQLKKGKETNTHVWYARFCEWACILVIWIWFGSEKWILNWVLPLIFWDRGS